MLIKSEYLSNLILDFAKSLADVLTYEDVHKDIKGYDEEKLNIFLIQAREIRLQLMLQPGLLIFIEDEKHREVCETVINVIWGKLDTEITDYENIYYSIIDSSEYFSQLFSIDEDYLVDIFKVLHSIDSKYLRRANHLRPTFISVKPKNSEFETLYQEAMSAWLFGLNIAAVNLCWAILESILKEKLTETEKIKELYPNGRPIKSFLRELIDKAYENKIICESDVKVAQRIRILRNTATHDLKPLSDDEIYKIIQHSKSIAEKILKTET